MPQFISPDVGRRLTKIISGSQQASFRSAVGEWRDLRLESQRDYEVEINGVKYFVGDLATESHFCRDMTTESKIHIETKVLFLTALALLAKEDKLIVTTGLPVKQHTEKIKRQLSELLCGTHSISINGEPPKTLHVENIGIVAEGIGFYWDELLDSEGAIQNKWLSTQPVVRVIDIGSRTINLGTVIYTPEGKRLYLDRESNTLNYGYIALESANSDPDDKVFEDFTRRIVADASRVWLTYNPAKDVVVLGGGGVITLGALLKEHYPISLVTKDPLFGNASGFAKMGMIRWQAEQKQSQNLR